MPRRLRRAVDRPTVVIEVNTDAVDGDVAEFMRAVTAAARSAGVRALVVDVADDTIREVHPLPAWSRTLLDRLYGTDLAARVAWFLGEHSVEWQHDPADLTDAIEIVRRDVRDMAAVYVRPFGPGSRVRITRDGLTSGALATIIGPEGNGNTAAPIPGWWVRLDRGTGPYSGALLWLRTDELAHAEDGA